LFGNELENEWHEVSDSAIEACQIRFGILGEENVARQKIDDFIGKSKKFQEDLQKRIELERSRN
jgi:hypothetical protein